MRRLELHPVARAFDQLHAAKIRRRRRVGIGQLVDVLAVDRIVLAVDGVHRAGHGGQAARQYGGTLEQFEQNRAAIRARGAAVGFEFNPAGRGRIYNTFNAHRLLHWAGQQGDDQQLALKRALLEAYHGRSEAVEQDDVLLAAAKKAGLDEARAQEILASDEFAAEVRAAERHYQQAGISSVPAVIINDRHLISGGQPPEVFEQALRQLAQAG